MLHGSRRIIPPYFCPLECTARCEAEWGDPISFYVRSINKANNTKALGAGDWNRHTDGTIDKSSAPVPEGLEMGKRQLLFVTHHDDDLVDSISYAIELAKAMDEDIMLLFVQKRSNLNSRLEDLMTAITFAEAGEHHTARLIASGDSRCAEEVYNKELDAVAIKCLQDGIRLDVFTSTLDAISGVRMFLKTHRAIDKVVLSPAITVAGNVSVKDMGRLVRTASIPIVTMTRQTPTVASEKERT